jgi:predicted nucleic acid-binding protein
MSGRSYLLDTNVVIGFLAGVDWAVDFVTDRASERAQLFTSTITRMELLSYPGISNDEESKILDFLSKIRIVGLASDIEDRAISVRKTTGLKLPDAIIAGTATAIGAVLVSADSDFDKVQNLTWINPSSS